MIIGRFKRGKVEGLLLGLSAENLRRLKLGDPIHVTKETHGEGIPDGWDLLITYGETEKDMCDELEKHGLLQPGVNVHPLPPGAE